MVMKGKNKGKGNISNVNTFNSNIFPNLDMREFGGVFSGEWVENY